MQTLEKYSIGIGDRFGLEGAAQLRAIRQAEHAGVRVVPVWNKSNREHVIIGSTPEDTRKEADAAVRACGWSHSYYVDADHIGLATVERFLASSNFFTIDVADYIGKSADRSSVDAFVKSMERFRGRMDIPGIQSSIEVTSDLLRQFAGRYLVAIEQARKVYEYIASRKGVEGFVTEISVDEAQEPQSPVELFFILVAIAMNKIPIQTIAPKFRGSFLKGIDYVGDPDAFAREFEDDLAVVAHALRAFELPGNLKLSIHTGSDKFSLYPHMHEAIRRGDAGLHLKTAGTTWLEEVIGLAASGGAGLAAAKEIYRESHRRIDELCSPYLTVISIDRSKLPTPSAVESWTSPEYVEALRHEPTRPGFNPHLRQLVHVGYKVAAEMGERFRGLLRECRREIETNVAANLTERHIVPLFVGPRAGRADVAGRKQEVLKSSP